MIRIAKGDPPEWIVTNGVTKTREYEAAPADKKPNPWNNDAIKDALSSETLGKCMYCEADPNASSYPAVEHIRPKETFPSLVLTWSNLGWACTRCNTNKGRYWSDHEDLRLLNPYEDDPENHLTYAGPLVVPNLGSERAKNTIRKLKLNREKLFLRRSQYIEELDERLQFWHSEGDAEKKELLAEDVRQFFSEGSEFSAILRAFAALRGFPVG